MPSGPSSFSVLASQHWATQLGSRDIHPHGESCGVPTRKPRQWQGGRELENIFLPLLNQHLSPETPRTAAKPCTAGRVICTAQPRDTTFWDLSLQQQKAQGRSEQQKENDKHRVNKHGFLQAPFFFSSQTAKLRWRGRKTSALFIEGPIC